MHCIDTTATQPHNQNRDKLASTETLPCSAMLWSSRIQSGGQKLSSPRLSKTKAVARSPVQWCNGTGAIYSAHMGFDIIIF